MSNFAHQSGFLAHRGPSPMAIGGAIVVHVGIAALVLALPGVPAVRDEITEIFIRNIPKDKPPEPEIVPPKPHPERAPQEITRTHSEVELPLGRTDGLDGVQVLPQSGGSSGLDLGDTPADPPHMPALVEARPDARYMRSFQPDYPAAMLRMEIEGAVTVRVLIDADGRVRDVILISAADPAFFDATRRQALRAWRFVPATRDGVPVASEKVMTVHFRLTD